MMTMFRSACPLNCPDSCAFLVENTPQGLRVRGDKENPLTRGFICPKGQALAKRIYSPDRLLYPMLKKGGGWQKITWDKAYSIVVEKIEAVCQTVGSHGILHHYDYGHNGVLRTLDRRFFQALGGVTEPGGSMCWGAGYRAQEIDFGGVYANAWRDVVNARLIILWGKDPAVTSIHLIPYLLEAKKQGARIIVINPNKVKSAEFADEYIRIQPGTDGALALGIAYVILKERKLDLDFVRNYVHGFEEYAYRVKEFNPEKVAQITGVSEETIMNLAEQIAALRPVSIFPGYGLQRYIGGGNTMRAIDALAAITGNIGRPGAGVHYAYQYHRGNLNSLSLPEERYQSRVFPHPILAEKLKEAKPQVQLAIVTRSNPLVQQPNSLLWREVWANIPFKVVLDTVMTETARHSDLILPIATIFEEEDLIFTSWSPLIQYTQAVVKPLGLAKPEPVIFTELAHRLGLESEFSKTPTEWIEYVIAPLKKYGISLDTLRQGPIYAPYFPDVAWEDKRFKTPSGKIELASERAKEEMGDRVANFLPAGLRQDAREYPWHLITPHPARQLHSQFHEEEGFTVYLHPDLASKCNLLPGDRAIVESIAGQLTAVVYVSEDIHPGTVVIPEGATADGFGVNQLTVGYLSDIGESTAYYDMRCNIRKWYLD